ncbi:MULTISPECIES: DUF4834 family protein [unclassified Dysgonomonas]|uniref:DUF4834 family protein n=1 Tax=unclassified Dysgonomonas TaxID=2630389 RepID=UPI0013ECF048|nr:MULTISPECIES: DUF4834 family protein [unclassified Dysgonomonas]
MKFLLILFIVFILVIFVFGSILGRVIRFFNPGNTNTNRRQQNKSRQSNENNSGTDNKKYFSDKEGEYVSYEEVKDEE